MLSFVLTGHGMHKEPTDTDTKECNMATIENTGVLDANAVRNMSDAMLIAQDLVQQGAVHAISYLLQHGCNEETAVQMLVSLRQNASCLREEAKRRGKPLFDGDQMTFN